MDKKTVLAFVLIFVIIILTPYVQRIFGPDRPQIDRSLIYPDSTNVLRDPPITERRTDRERVEPEAQVQDTREPSEFGLENLMGLPEEEVVIETPLYTGVISTKGATVKSWVLHSYLKNGEGPVNIIDNNDRGNLSVAFLSIEDNMLDFSPYGFTPQNLEKENDRYYVDVRERVKTITFVLPIDNEKRIEKVFTFYPDKYDFDLKVRLINLADMFGARSYFVTWGSGLAFSEMNPQNELTYAKAYALLGNDLDRLDAGGKTEEQSKALSGDTRWVAVRNKYFTSTIIPKDNNGTGAFLRSILKKSTGMPDKKEYQANLEMAYGMTRLQEDNFTIYLGPLQYNTIKNFSVQLEKMMDFGWKYLRPISKLIYHSLVAMHNVIPNYGVVIIIFAIILNILLYPLTMKSFKSMKEMQVLQPKLMELKEKYKGEPQRLNKETMKMYKEYGVNPMGSCLPMLLQMPVFFALYPVFRSSIEFRAAQFVLWIKDLSIPDTVAHLPFSFPMYGNAVNVLPIIWVVTMFFSQKMTMKDPKQKMMVYFMPIMMLLFFNNLSSGLVLYWTVFNVLSVLQRRITKTG